MRQKAAALRLPSRTGRRDLAPPSHTLGVPSRCCAELERLEGGSSHARSPLLSTHGFGVVVSYVVVLLTELSRSFLDASCRLLLLARRLHETLMVWRFCAVSPRVPLPQQLLTDSEVPTLEGIVSWKWRHRGIFCCVVQACPQRWLLVTDFLYPMYALSCLPHRTKHRAVVAVKVL